MNFLNDIAELKAALAKMEPRSWAVRIHDRDVQVSERDGMTLTAALLLAIETRKPVQVTLASGASLSLREGDFAMVMQQIIEQQNGATVAEQEPVS